MEGGQEGVCLHLENLHTHSAFTPHSLALDPLGAHAELAAR